MVATGQTNLETGSAFQSSLHMPQAAGALGGKKKKGCQRRGDNQGFGDEGGIGALQETKERTKKIALGEPGLCQQFPEFIFY